MREIGLRSSSAEQRPEVRGSPSVHLCRSATRHARSRVFLWSGEWSDRLCRSPWSVVTATVDPTKTNLGPANAKGEVYLRLSGDFAECCRRLAIGLPSTRYHAVGYVLDVSYVDALELFREIFGVASGLCGSSAASTSAVQLEQPQASTRARAEEEEHRHRQESCTRCRVQLLCGILPFTPFFTLGPASTTLYSTHALSHGLISEGCCRGCILYSCCIAV